MTNLFSAKGAARGIRICLLATSLLAGAPALAQLTTSTIRGVVSSGTTAAPGATVTAVNVETNATTRTVAGPNGSYVLTGLSPGTYDIKFVANGGATSSQRVTIEVGQTASLDADTAAATASPPGDRAAIVVVGRRLVETRTSEIGTNVSQEQIENLPQNNRNFINFAALAPGIRVNQSEFRQTFAGAGVGTDKDGESTGGPQVNVFIDGVSLKGNVNQGGIVGQDVSRGNPFSQLAVKEFRVLSSNFKAEFEDAGTAIITAVTKSGTNDFHGEAFVSFQNEKMIERDFFQKKNNEAKKPLKRYQYGAALGGPIIRDKLFFFGTYEANIQDRISNVVPGSAGAQANLINFDPQIYAGSYVSPFREKLGFGKLTLQATENQKIELSGSIRKETDLRDFGGTTARSKGTKVNNDVYTAKLSHTYRGDGLLNEATIDFLKSKLAFGGDQDAGFGFNYPFVQFGGRADFQTVQQRSVTFRDNLSFSNVHWNGNHLIKIGAKVSFQKYSIGGSGSFNPQFDFFNDPSQNLDISLPGVVRFGGGNPNLTAKTTQIGLFAQDDWEVSKHLLINAGLRWDYDSNAKNNAFVTPPRAIAALQNLALDPRIQPAFYNVNDYISTGNRKADLKNFAPRLGFSYDVNADQRTVFFGGYGRYYDRALFRNAAEESLKGQFRTGEILFSKDGLPRFGQPTIQFQPQYLTPAGFTALLAQLAADPTRPGTDELRVIPNNLKTPYTDQFSIGVRQRVGILRTSLTFNHTVGRNQIGYAPLNRSTNPGSNGFYDYIPLINGYGNIIAAFNTRRTKYDAIFATIDKPYTKASHWGGGIAYTGVLRSKQRGSEFNFDYPNIGEQEYVPNAGNEKHRIVANGIVDLPFDVKASTLVTYGSGAPFFVIDANRAPPPQGFQPGTIRLGYFNNLPYFLQVDFRLQKSFKLFGDKEFTVSGEVFNVFNRANFGGADGFICCGGNPNFGVPNSLSGPPRSFQIGASAKF
ncbi:TonB-dependent receptor [Sphingomonas sp.]|uniref:TonB-dependent receptor n=1 Tax=Sphingomonas sp. TaxID=28214 RepID=UPI00260015BB|nr:TonB-dependent receptor [Sphingomonas sp.]